MKIKNIYEQNPQSVDELVRLRGIEDIDKFLNPSLDDILSPMLLDNCAKAVNLIKEMNGKKAMTIVDSDSDGYNASAILLNYLRNVYPDWEIEFFIHEGKNHGLEDVADRDIDLDEYDIVFLPDAGSNDDYYFEMHPNTKFLVMDHHLRTVCTEAPKNAIIVNNQLSDNYTNKALSGAGVTWQVCRAMDQTNGTNYADQFYDMVAVAVIGDVMNITTPENRAIISYGLEHFENRFLTELRDAAAYSIGDELTPTGVAFYIVPSINAMCRMGTLAEKIRMFLSFTKPSYQVECHKRGVSKGTMVDVVIESVRECTNAKAHQKKAQTQMAELCEKVIVENDLLANKILIIELGEEFEGIPSEMNGLTATKLSNDYGHPTLIGRVCSDGFLKGSIRGLSTIDMPPLKEFLLSSGLFDYCEGHSLAAGFSIAKKNVGKFLEWSNERLKDVNITTKTWSVDFNLSAQDANLSNIIISLEKLSNLWGQGFPEALIYIKDIKVSRADIQVMGKNSDTVKVTYKGISYMFFKRSMEEVKQLIAYPHARFNIVGTANVNRWMNKVTPQIFVSDYEIFDDTLGF